jgi:hypothetical protein
MQNVTNPVSLRFIVCRMFLPSTRSVRIIFSIFLQHHISELSRQFWSTLRRIQFSAPHKAKAMLEIWHFTNTIKLNMYSVWHNYILVNEQLDALFLDVFISCLCMFRTTSAHHQEDQLVSIHHLGYKLIQAGLPDDEHLLLETCRGMK